MELDEALGRLGDWGRWQVLYFLMLSMACMFPASWHMFAIVFIGGQPDYRCQAPTGVLINETIPAADNGSSAKCEVYVGNNKTELCTDWEYFGDVGHTIVSQWDLVCDREYLKDLSQTVLVIGVIFGAMVFTSLSDHLGRKPVFLFTQWALAVVGVANAFVPSYHAFLALRFCTGALQQGLLLSGFVMACELFAAKNRTFAGIMIENFWSIATGLFALLAYLIRNWVYLQLLISLFGLLTIPLFWIMPESVVWLYANNRVDEAERVIRRAAKLNNIALPGTILAARSLEIMVSPSKQMSAAPPAKSNGRNGCVKASKVDNGRVLSDLECFTRPKGKDVEVKTTRYTLLDVFRNFRLAMYTLCMSFLWMAISLVYYGLTLSAGELAGNRYFNIFLSGMVEMPAYLFSFIMLQKYGRRRSLIVCHVITGVALIISSFVPLESGGVDLLPLKTTLSTVGKFGITGAFSIVFLYTPEIFPTSLRSQAMGVVSFLGRIGSMIAPFTATVARILPWLPGVLFGGLSIGGSLLILFLPETLNRPLPQTIEDIENWSKKPTGKPGTQQHDVDGNVSVDGNVAPVNSV